MYGGYNYLELDYSPGKNDFIVLLWVKAQCSLERAAEAIAAESSVGTFTEVKTMNQRVFTNYRARVFEITKVQENAGFVKIAYPYQHFDTKNLIQFEASVMGNIFGMHEVEELYICDIMFPEKFQRQFKGPFGMEKIRKYVGTNKKRRPHVGTIVKPKVGLTPQEFSEVAYNAWLGGLDLVKDDENLVDQPFCRWQERFDATYEKLDKVEKETGEKKLYATNVSDSCIDRMIERIEYVAERGAKMVMLDVYVLGFPAVKAMVDLAHKYNLFVHAHRAGYAAWHRGRTGVSFQVMAKFYRMLGVDQLHVGTGVGKMDGSPKHIQAFAEVVKKQKAKARPYLGMLKQTWHSSIAPVFPVSSGGLHPGLVEGVVEIFGNDVVIQAGGGVHGHPKGTLAGAKAMRAMVEGLAEGLSAEQIAKKHKEVKEAFKKFGRIPRERVRATLQFFDENEDVLNRMVLKLGIDAMWELERGIEPRG